MDNNYDRSCPYSAHCGSFYVYAKCLSEDLHGTFIKMYCHGIYNKCARWMVINEGKAGLLPADILPNQEIRARSLVKEDQKLYS